VRLGVLPSGLPSVGEFYMASILASSAFQMNNLNFYEVTAGAYDSQFLDNIYLPAGGTIFEDMYTVFWFDGTDWSSTYLGSGFVLNSQGSVVAGTVTAYAALMWYGSNFSEYWEISNFSISASSLYNAHVTPGTSDDFAIMQSVLSGADSLTGSPQSDFLMGYAGNDTFLGNSGADTLDGGAGNDTLDGGAGADSLAGGAGNDHYIVNHALDLMIEAAGGGTDVIVTSASITVPLNMEEIRIATGSSALTITGGLGSETIIGNGLSNNLYGGAGDDVLLASPMNPADILALFNGWPAI
jgi:Ca2+-binding RTX toxin-like protein